MAKQQAPRFHVTTGFKSVVRNGKSFQFGHPTDKGASMSLAPAKKAVAWAIKMGAVPVTVKHAKS